MNFLPITQGMKVNASQISGIIALINNEENNRVMGLTDLNVVSQGAKFDDPDQSGAVARLDLINAHHCYCESDVGIETHQGGTTLTLSSTTVSEGDKFYALDWDNISGDIVALSGQCDCDGYLCSCETRQVFTCTCNIDCNCYIDCGCYFDAK